MSKSLVIGYLAKVSALPHRGQCGRGQEGHAARRGHDPLHLRAGDPAHASGSARRAGVSGFKAVCAGERTGGHPARATSGVRDEYLFGYLDPSGRRRRTSARARLGGRGALPFPGRPGLGHPFV